MAMKLKVDAGFWDDQEWGLQHYGELVGKYHNEWIAIVGKQVVSHGYDAPQVEAEAAKKTGKAKNQIPLMYVEAGNQIL